MTHQETPILTLDDVRTLANNGAADLAILEGIRAYVRCDSSSPERIALLNDLAVLRHAAGDLRGALRILERAAAECPDASLVRENLEALEALEATTTEPACDAREVNSGAANPWVLEGLRELDRSAGLEGLSVIELGGSIPARALERIAARSWTSVDLEPVGVPEASRHLVGSDASRLPFAEGCFDAAFSVCAFEHFDDVAGVLREVHRVLRPGALFFAQFSPIWSCAIGHHVWICDDDAIVTFNDGIVPDWAHLVLSEEELLAFLSLTLDKSVAERVASFAYHGTYLNRRFEAEFQRAFEDSGFDIESRSVWGGRKGPSGALAADLARRWPEGGDFSSYGIRISLRKPA